MSLESLNLTIQSITPPDGLQHKVRKEEILELPSYLRVNAASAGDEVSVAFVSSAEPGPSDTDKVWVKPDNVATASGISQPGCYLYDSVTGTWQLIAGLGIYVGTSAPSDTKVLWLNTTDGTSLKGFYRYNGSSWELVASPGIYVGTTAPTDTTRPWLKTDDVTTVRGLYVWSGSAWILMAGVGLEIVSTPVTPPTATDRLMVVNDDLDANYGIGAHVYNPASVAWLPAHKGKTIIYQQTAPASVAERKCLWFRLATGGDMSQGLFYWNGANWKSLTPITVWMSTGSLQITTVAGTFNIPSWFTFPVPFDASPAPFIAFTLTADDQPANILTIGAWSPTGTDITVAGYSAYAGIRNVTANVMATGHQTR